MNDEQHGERTEPPEGDRQVRCPFDPTRSATIARRPDSDLVTLFAAWLGRPLGVSLPAWRLIDEVYSREADAEVQWHSLAEDLRQGRLKGQERVGLFTLAKVFPADFEGIDDLLVPLMGEGRLDELGRPPEDTRGPEEIARDHETIAELVLRNHGRPGARRDRLVVGKGSSRRRWVGLGDELGVGPLGGGWVQGDVPTPVDRAGARGGAGEEARHDAGGDRSGEFDFATFARLGRELVATAKEHLGADDRGLIGRLVSAAPRYARAELAGETAAAEPIANELGAVWHDINQANIPEAVWWGIQGYQEPFESRFGKLDDFAAAQAAPVSPPEQRDVTVQVTGLEARANPNAEEVGGVHYASATLTGSATISVSAVRINIGASHAAIRSMLTAVTAQRPNSDDEIARKGDVVRRLTEAVQLLEEAEKILDAGAAPMEAARPVARSLIVMMEDLDKLDPQGSGVKIINTTLGIVIACTAALLDSMIPAPMTFAVMATGVYGTPAVTAIMDRVKNIWGGAKGAPPSDV